MEPNALPVNQSNWTPLSATYALDQNITLNTIPFKTKDGYEGFYQSVYNAPFDSVANKETIFHLPSASKLMDFLTDNGKSIAYTGGYTNIFTYVDNTKYYMASNSDGTQLSLTSAVSDAMFMRVDINDDNTLSFYYGINKLITIKANTQDLYLDSPLSILEDHRQKFSFEMFDNDQVAILSQNIYWAYRTTGPNKFVVRANGYINNGVVINDYVFVIPGLAQVVTYDPTGLTTGHTWVTYHDDVANKTNNKNVVLDVKQEVAVQHLVDNPYYNSDTENKKTDVNIANLKSVMTGEYAYDCVKT